MRAYVFNDPALASEAGRFVWLEVDTEKAQNAPFRQRFPVVALPTYFVLDPAEEKVALRWVGSATAPQLKKLLAEGRGAVTQRSAARARTALERTLARADSLYGAGDDQGAVEGYGQALAAAPRDWPPYARAVESLLFALSRTGGSERCASLALEALPRLRRTPSAGNVAASGLGCARDLPAEHPRRDEWVSKLEALTREVVEDTTLAMAADDRSGVYIALYETREAAKDEEGRRRVATEWAAYLEREAGRAASPEQRAVFDSHRLSAYLELGEPERAIPMLEASERDLPDDYNPPARLAVAYRALKRWDEALAASDRALAKAYGPRKLGMLQVRADIYVGRGEPAAARRTLEEALAYAEALPPGQRSERTIEGIRKKLEGME